MTLRSYPHPLRLIHRPDHKYLMVETGPRGTLPPTGWRVYVIHPLQHRKSYRIVYHMNTKHSQQVYWNVAEAWAAGWSLEELNTGLTFVDEPEITQEQYDDIVKYLDDGLRDCTQCLPNTQQ